jgi:hypothetical protein
MPKARSTSQPATASANTVTAAIPPRAARPQETCGLALTAICARVPAALGRREGDRQAVVAVGEQRPAAHGQKAEGDMDRARFQKAFHATEP